MNVEIKLKSGITKKFPEGSRAGGSWSQQLKYEGAFAIVIDVWGNQTAIPAEDIEEIKTSSHRY